MTNIKAKAQVCLDLHKALGVEFGHDPYARIAKLKAAEVALAEHSVLLREMYALILNHEVQLMCAGGGIWTWPDRAKLAFSLSGDA